MRVLITGITGFLGKEIKKHYLMNGDEIISIGRSKYNDIVIDFFDFDVTELANNIGHVDTIVHCAAVNEVEINKSIDQTYAINVVLTRKLVELSKLLSIKNFIYISTFHVYGESSGWISDESEIKPINDYGLTHYLSEEIIRTNSYYNQYDYLIIRPTNIYGVPSDFKNFNRWTLVPFQFLKSAYYDGKIVINSSGQQYRNFVSISDVIQCLSLIGKEKVVNAYGTLELSISDFAKIIGKLVGRICNKNVLIEVTGVQEPGNYQLNVTNHKSQFKPSPSELESFIMNMIKVKEKWEI